MIITVTLNPSIDKIILIDDFTLNSVCRGNIINIAAGGKGINVSRAVKILGGKTFALGVTGGETGDLIIKGLKSQGIAFDSITVKGESRICYALIDRKKKTETIINESGPEVPETRISRFIKLYRKMVKTDDIVILSGSAARGFKREIYKELIKIANKKKAKVILDTSGQYLSEAINAIPYIVKVNKAEMKGASIGSLSKKEPIMKKINTVLEMGVYAIVITHGHKKVYAYTKEKHWTVSPPRIKSVSNWGAGDCVVAGIALSLEKEESFEKALKFGITAGSANSLSYGAGNLNKKKIKGLLKKVLIRTQFK